jgi:hypothetical protein
MTSLATPAGPLEVALELAERRVAILLSGLGQVRDSGITPTCFICEKTSTIPQVSVIRPPVKRRMKISLYVTDLPVGGRPNVFAQMGPGNRVAADDLVPLLDQVLDRDLKVGESPVEPVEHLLE